MILGSLGAQLGTVDAQLGALVVIVAMVAVVGDPEIAHVPAESRVVSAAADDRTVRVSADHDRLVYVPHRAT